MAIGSTTWNFRDIVLAQMTPHERWSAARRIDSGFVSEYGLVLLIGFVLFLEGGHVAGLTVNGSEFPYIPQWIVIFILLLMFSVDLYQNWWERKAEKAPVALRRRRK